MKNKLIKSVFLLNIGIMAQNIPHVPQFIETLSQLGNFNSQLVDSIYIYNIVVSNNTVWGFNIPGGFIANNINTTESITMTSNDFNNYYFNSSATPYVFYGDTVSQQLGINFVQENANNSYVTVRYSYVFKMFELQRITDSLTNEFIAIIPELNANNSFLNKFVQYDGYLTPNIYTIGGSIDFYATILPSAFSSTFAYNGQLPIDLLKDTFQNYLSTGSYVIPPPLGNFTTSAQIYITGGNSSLMSNGNLTGWIESVSSYPEIIGWYATSNFSSYLKTDYNYTAEIENSTNSSTNLNYISVVPISLELLGMNGQYALNFEVVSNVAIEYDYLLDSFQPSQGLFIAPQDASYVLSFVVNGTNPYTINCYGWGPCDTFSWTHSAYGEAPAGFGLESYGCMSVDKLCAGIFSNLIG
jgi:hypothetical protein